MKNHFKYFLSVITILSVVWIFSCTKEEIINGTPPANPYAGVDYSVDSTPPAEPDPNSITGIHKNILSVKCANPGCHDGNFEPDYRSVMSSYNTLVYHKVVKNSSDSSFKYRVIPYDTSGSWFHERLTTDNATLGRMPLYSNPLSSTEMTHINTWIMNGAKDMFGNLPVKPDSRPTVIGYLAMDSSFTVRYDTTRVGGVYYNAFILPQNSNIKIIFLVEDDNTPVANMQVNKMKVSDFKNDFAAASVFQAIFLSIPPYELWIADINTGLYSPGSTHYFRYYINDGFHTADTEFPGDAQVDPYKTYFSFIVQ